MKPVTVVAVLKAKPGKEEDLRSALLGLVEPTRAENGCLQYDLHVSTEAPGEFVFYENWASRAALDEHMQTPHLTAVAGRVDELMSDPPSILTYERIA